MTEDAHAFAQIAKIIAESNPSAKKVLDMLVTKYPDDLGKIFGKCVPRGGNWNFLGSLLGSHARTRSADVCTPVGFVFTMATTITSVY